VSFSHVEKATTDSHRTANEQKTYSGLLAAPGSTTAGVVLHVGKSKMCAQHFD